jgi:hypothetical protein
MGARGVRRVDTEEELREFLLTALGQSVCRKAIIEEYIPGPEFSIDALVYRGEIIPCGFADRHITFSPYFVEMGHTIPTGIPKAAEEEILEVFYRGTRALGIDEGAAKGDVKLTDSGPVIGEIAARLSGGYMSGWTYPYASGVDPTSAALNIAVGLPPGDLTPRFNRITAERAFISIPGKVRAVEGVGEAGEDVSVKEIFVNVQPGARVTFPENNVQKCGNIIAVAPSRESAESAALKAAGRIRVRLEPGDRDTLRFLTGRNCLWAPDAYSFENKLNREALERMPEIILRRRAGTGGNRGAKKSAETDRALGIILLPDMEGEETADWMGRGFAASLRELRRRYTLEVFPPTIKEEDFAESGERGRKGEENIGASGELIILGRIFWKVFSRGGVQAAGWLCESVLDEGSEGATVRCLIGEE